METVGDRVRRYRRLRRLTQEALATQAEVDRRYLGRIETGEVQEPGVDTVRKLAKALGVPIRAIANPEWYDDESTNDWLAGLRADERLDEDAKALIERLVRREYDARERGNETDTAKQNRRAV